MGRSKNDAGLGVLIMLAFFIITPFVVLGVTRYFKGITLEQNLTGKLKQAADANGIPLAQKKLTECIAWMEKNDLTEGSTHVWIKTPECDIEFFYQNLVTAKKDLDNFPLEPAENATPDERTKHDLAESNQLIKLRETLLDSGEQGTHVTCPPNLAVYPSQMFWWWVWPLACIWTIVVIIFGAVNWNWNV